MYALVYCYLMVVYALVVLFFDCVCAVVYLLVVLFFDCVYVVVYLLLLVVLFCDGVCHSGGRKCHICVPPINPITPL